MEADEEEGSDVAMQRAREGRDTYLHDNDDDNNDDDVYQGCRLSGKNSATGGEIERAIEGR